MNIKAKSVVPFVGWMYLAVSVILFFKSFTKLFPIFFSPWRHAPQPFYYNSPMRILNLLELFYLLRILQHPRWFYHGIHIAFGSFREGEHFLKLFPNSTLPVFRAV